MKDATGTIYIDWDDFVYFVLSTHGGLTPTEFHCLGRPRMDGQGDIEIEYAYSETGVAPDEWGGKKGEKAKAIVDSWKEE